MQVSSLLHYLREQGITVKNKKKIDEKVSAWLNLQTAPSLCLTAGAKRTLETHFELLQIPAHKITQLVDLVAQKTLFPHAQGPLEKLQALIDSPKPTQADYQSLLETANALLCFLKEMIANKRFYWLQEKHRALRLDNPLITTKLREDNKTHDLSLWLNFREGSNPAIQPIVVYLRNFFAETSPPASSTHSLDQFKIPERVLQALLLFDALMNNPEVHQYIEHVMASQELVSVEAHFQESIDRMASHKPPFSQELIRLCRCLIPMPPRYVAFLQSSGNFDLYQPFDASVMFQELEETYGPYTPTLLSTYQLILERIRTIKNCLSAQKQQGELPAPQADLEELTHLMHKFIGFPFQTDFSSTRQRLEANVPALLSQIERTTQNEPSEIALLVPPQSVDVLLKESSPFPVNERVLKWFDPHFDPFSTEKKYLHLLEGKKEEIRFQHNFAWIINQIAYTYGHVVMRHNSGEVYKRITMAIQAETPFSTTPVLYMLTIAFDSSGVACNRTLSQQPQESWACQLLTRGFFEGKFPPFSSQKEDLVIDKPWLHTRAPDNSHIVNVKGRVIVVADPKWPLASGQPTLLHVMAV